MPSLESIAYALVVISAAIYIRKELARSLKRTVKKTFKHHMQRFRQEEQEARESITPRFDLWWQENGKPQVEQHFADMPQGPFAVHFSHLGEVEFEGDPRTEMVRQEALEFATHLSSKHLHDRLTKAMGLKRVQRQEMDEDRERHLDEHRSTLVRCGIDLKAFESEFTPTSGNS